MAVSSLFKTAGTLIFVGTLAACVDVSMEIEVLNETNGRATTALVMDREFYDMSQAQGGGDFCEDDGVLTVTDTAATCLTTEEGSFDELLEDTEDGEPAPTITSIGHGLIQVTFPTGSLAEDFGEDGDDPETLAMLTQFFEGHNMTLTISGGEITKTNMTIAPDGQSASIVIPLLGMITGEAVVPDEVIAVVKIN